MSEESFVGGKLFRKIEVDERITSDLDVCIYCKVSSYNKNGTVSNIDYKIPLNCINGNMFKQCPACKRIYVLSDPTK